VLTGRLHFGGIWLDDDDSPRILQSSVCCMDTSINKTDQYQCIRYALEIRCSKFDWCVSGAPFYIC